MIPADQRLHADNEARRQLNLLLKEELEFAAFEGAAKIGDKRNAVLRLAIEVAGMEAVFIPALLLCPKERKLGLGHNVARAARLKHAGRNPDADGYMHFRVADQVGSR